MYNFLERISALLIIFIFSLFFVSSAKAASYDLEVADIIVSPSNPAISEPVEIKIRVKNNDVTNLDSLLGVNSYQIDFDDFSLDEVVLPNISEVISTDYKEFFSYTIKGSFNEIGTSRLYFYTNRNQSLPESSFGNNYIRKDIEVRAAEDLSVKSITMEPAYVPVGQKTTIKIIVKNNGTRELTSPNGINSYLLDLPDFTVEDKTIPVVSNTSRFKSGEELEYIFEGRFKTSGEKNLSFQVDYSDDLEEFNEENNSIEHTTVVAEADNLDLAIASINFSKDKETLLAGDIVTITVDVENKGAYSLLTGDGLYERNYHLSYGGDFDYESPNIDIYEVIYPTYPSGDKPLAPGSKLSYTLRGTVYGGGIGSFSATIDQGNLLEELDEDNNTMAVEFMSYLDADRRDDFEVLDITCEAISSTSLKISWQTTQDTGNYLQFREPRESYFNAKQKLKDQKWLDSNNKQDHTITISDLSPDTQHFFIISSRNNEVEKDSKEITCNTPLNDPVETSRDTSQPADDTSQLVDETPQPVNETPQPANETSQSVAEPTPITNKPLYEKLSGKIILKVESAGEAYYVNPQSEEMHYLGRPDDAFSVMRSQGVGITNLALFKIPIGLTPVNGPDTDNDGLSDALEDALGTSKTQGDTDGDGFSDKEELSQNYNPLGTADLILDKDFARKQAGKIFLQVEAHGEAWYLNPADEKRYFLGRPDDAFAIMRQLGLGISNTNFDSL